MARLAIDRPATREQTERAAARPRAAGGWLERVAPWLVFGLAAAFRLAALDLAAFTYDEADVILRARAVAQGQIALTGAMTSWGFPDPPLQVYLLAPLARLPWPVPATLAFMALLNALTVLGTYAFAARFFGWRFGLLAGLLFAVNPWAIYFGRRVWDQLQPALTVLALWSTFEVVVGRRAAFGLPFFLALAANVQARLLAAAYAPAALLSLALGGRAWRSRFSALGILGGLLLSLPYAAYLLTNRERIGAILAEGNRGLGGAPRRGVFEFVWWLSAGLNLLPTPSGLAPWLDQLGPALWLQAWLAGSLLAAGLALGVIRVARHGAGWRRQALLLGWAMFPLGLVALQSSAVYLHYLVLLVPLPFLLMALPLEALAGLRTPLRRLAPLLCLAVALPQAAAWIALERTLTIYDTNEAVEAPLADRRLLAELGREQAQRLGTGERYGIEVPVRYWLAVADRARAELAARPRDLLVVTEGTDPLADEQPAILEAVLGPDLHPGYLVPDPLLLPLDRAVLLLVAGDIEPALTPERLGQRLALIPLPTLGRNARVGTRFLDLPARSAADWVAAVGAEPATAGAAFLRIPPRARVGEELELLTLWPGPIEGLRPRAALVGSDGQRIEEGEAVKRRPAVEVAADRLAVARHRFEVPMRASGEYRVMVDLTGAGGREIELGRVTIQAR